MPQLIDHPANTEDRLWWAHQNTESHDEPTAPRFVVQYLPSSNGWYPDWSVVDTRDDTIVASFATLDEACAELRDQAPAPTDPDPAGEARPEITSNRED